MTTNSNGAALGLYQRHRPRTLDQVVGQPAAVKTIESWFRKRQVPHAVALTGGSGVGKTTLARIIARKLGCQAGDKPSTDYTEINAASDRGIEMTRDLQRYVNLPGLGAAGNRVWVIDESARMTRDAQSSLLKTLEDVPRHAYFVLCTTDPDKLLPTVKTRCTFVDLKAVARPDLVGLMAAVCAKEGADVSAAVLARAAETAEGSPRQALVLLEAVLKLDDEDDRLAAVEKRDLEKQAFDLVRALVYFDRGGKPDPRKIVEVLRGLENNEAEDVRRMVLACARTELFKVGKNFLRAVYVIKYFKDFSDSGKAGHAKLAYAALAAAEEIVADDA